ncbi:MAG: hypothetical protein JST69_10820 [Bacteroidetes bacterium]|nr:hypothetical protein [Bacteroidota bacterium]
MQKIIKMHYLLSIFITCAMLFTRANTQKEEKVRIDAIYVCHYHIFRPWLEYKIDLKNKSFWKYDAGISAKERNGSTKNEGYDFVETFTDDKIVSFISDADKNGFVSWEEKYNNLNIDGGHKWSIMIAFHDGTVKHIDGSNQYPKTWEKMNLAFKRLTGENILKM